MWGRDMVDTGLLSTRLTCDLRLASIVVRDLSGCSLLGKEASWKDNS